MTIPRPLWSKRALRAATALVGGLGRRLTGLARDLRRDERAMMAIETAIALPILTSLMLSGVEYGRYMLIVQKADRAAAVLADLVSQSEILNSSDLEDMFLAVGYVMDPYNDNSKMGMIVSSFINEGDGATIVWQRDSGGLGVSSEFGSEGSTPSLPTGFVVRTGENVIAAEFYLDFEPLFLPDDIAAKVIRTVALFRPRFATLDRVVDS